MTGAGFPLDAAPAWPSTCSVEESSSAGLVVAGRPSLTAIALMRLAVARGWRVAFIGAEPAPGLRELGVQAHMADIADSIAIEAVLSTLTSRWGAAPIAIVHFAQLERVRATVTESSEDWGTLQHEQLGAAFAFAQVGAKEMLRLRGGSAVDDGSVVFVGEVSAARGIPGHPQTTAGAALAGLTGLTRQLAVEWGRLGIRVNMVQAGAVSPAGEHFSEVLRRVPLGRAGSPEEIAEACYYLISRASSYVTGAVLPVDGGFLAT